MERLAKTASFLVIASMMRNVITSMVAVLTAYVHQAGRAMTAAMEGVCLISTCNSLTTL